MGDVAMDESSASAAAVPTALTPYHRQQDANGTRDGPYIVMNSEAQALIRTQLHSFLAATQREINHDTQNNVRLSHDDLYRALAARVDAGIQHIGNLREEVEERALTVAESRVNAMVTSSRQTLNSDLDRLLNERLENDIQRAIVVAKRDIQDSAVKAAETRTLALTQGVTAQNDLYQALSARVDAGILRIGNLREEVEERVLTVAESRVNAMVASSRQTLNSDLDRLLNERLENDIQRAIVVAKRDIQDSAVKAAETRTLALTQGVTAQNDLYQALSARVDAGILRIGNLREEVEERALTVAESRVNAMVTSSRQTLNSDLDRLLNERLENDIQRAIVVAKRDIQDSAVKAAETRTLALTQGVTAQNDLYQALSARVDAGILRIGNLREEVEERALTVAESRVNAMVASSRQTLNSDLDRLLNERLENDIQRAIVVAKREILDSAIKGAESAMQDRLDCEIAERLTQGVEDTIAQVQRRATDRTTDATNTALAKVLADTKLELERLIQARLDDTCRARLESSLRAATSDIQQEVVEKALATVEARVLANRSGQTECSVTDVPTQDQIQLMIDKALKARCADDHQEHSHDDSVESIKDSAISAVKCYEAAGRMIAERRCEEVLSRLEDHTMRLLAETKLASSVEASTHAREQARMAAKESEKKLLDLHEKLLRELHLKVGAVATSSDQGVEHPDPTNLTASARSNNHDEVKTGTCVCNSKYCVGDASHEIEIKMGELQVRVRTRGDTAATDSGTDSANANRTCTVGSGTDQIEGQLKEAIETAIRTAKERALKTFEVAISEAKERAEAEVCAQNALSAMQARQRRTDQEQARVFMSAATATERRILREIEEDLDD